MKIMSAISFAVGAFLIAVAPGRADVTGDQAISKSVTFAVTCDGTAPFTYQWKKNAVALPGATAATLTIAAVKATDAGTYTVTVSNKAGAVESDRALFTVTINPTTATVSVSTP
jgi:hypothetical protein